MTRDHDKARPLVVACFTGNSGLTDYAVSFCREVARSRPVVLMTAGSIELDYRDMGFPVETIFRRSRHYPIDIFRFLRRVVARRPAAVLFEGPLKFAFLDALAVRYLRARGIPVAVVVHDVVPHSQRVLSTLALHVYYRSFPQLVVHSDEAIGRLRRARVRGRMLAVPHGRYDIFDLDDVTRAGARAALGIDEARTVALFFGYLEERKGIAVFVDAAVRNHDDSLLFLAAGADFLTPRAPEEVRAVVRGGRMVPGLRIDVGRVAHRDVQNYFRAADVVVLPYREGSTSGVLKLAMAFGVPVLATDVGDLREQVADGAGLLLSGTPTPDMILDGIAAIVGDERRTDPDDRLAWSMITPQVVSFLLDRP